MGHKHKVRKTLAFVVSAVAQETDDCIIWPFSLCHGYGVCRDENGKSSRAHIIACRMAHGARPEGGDVAHSCGNKACLNPRHLRWATRSENEMDKVEHGRSLRGTRHHHNKLTDAEARLIKSSNERGVDLAKAFGVTPSQVCAIRNGRSWGWL